MNTPSTQLLSAEQVAGILERLATESIERHAECSSVILVGIQRRGADLARRLQGILHARLGRQLPLTDLDINLYRDDWTSSSSLPVITHTPLPQDIPQDITDKVIILVDDVLFTGRTIRAALEALLDFGRPRRVELMVLVDRGHRELPIQPDYTGLTLASARADHVDVRLAERDGEDGVFLTQSA